MSRQAIGLFDSGLGGLTVARAVREIMPGEDIVYIADSGRCPYGPRPQEEVRRFSLQLLDRLAGEGVKLVIVACNTATAALLAEWPTNYPFPVLGVIAPGARAAVAATQNGRIGLLATEGTVRSGAYAQLIAELRPGTEVHAQACPKFVAAVEAGLDQWAPEVVAMAREYVGPLVERGIDTLVLGCTHFPHLTDVIGRTAGPGVRLVDPAAETAREARELLVRVGTLAGGEGGQCRFFTTGDPATFVRLGNVLWPGGVTNCGHIDA